MSTFRTALANIRYPESPEASVHNVEIAVAAAGRTGARIVCFPECCIPGYRAARDVPAPEQPFLEQAWERVAQAAARAGIAVILGTERVVDGAHRITTLVINADGSRAGFQDKVQLDPSEDALYAPGTERRVFQCEDATFGIVICHEGWRYPETVRWAARRGAQIVFHPHYGEAESAYVPSSFADPANTFHEKAALCRAAENTCWFASVNHAVPGASTTSLIARPDGTVLAWQPYGEEGLLTADIDLDAATRLLAMRWKAAAG